MCKSKIPFCSVVPSLSNLLKMADMAEKREPETGGRVHSGVADGLEFNGTMGKRE